MNKELSDAVTVVTGTRNTVVRALVVDKRAESQEPYYETVAFARKYVELETDEPETYLKELFIGSMSDRGLTIVTPKGEDNA
jgi:hypothetical protein